MKKYFSIAELEQYTKIKAHTFRTWEQRFALRMSRRGENNLRFYTIDDLDYFLDFSLLNRFGQKVSKLADLNAIELKERIYELEEEEARKENIVHKLIVYMFSLETEAFESTLDHAISRYGIDQVMDDVILSFLERIELFSYKGNTSTEYHFAVTVLRKKIIVAIEQSKVRSTNDKTALLFLPVGEHFDLLLLYIHYKLRMAGITSFYMGTNIQSGDVDIAAQKKHPSYLITYLHENEKIVIKKMSAYLSPTNGHLLLVSKPYLPVQQAHSTVGKMRIIQFKDVVKQVETHTRALEEI